MAKQLTYAQQMEQVLEQLGNTRPRLLLHACCGPCSSAVLEKLCAHFEITVLNATTPTPGRRPNTAAGARSLPAL